jgi:Arc/MetJ family transcription regulator
VLTLPSSRGPLSALLLDELVSPVHELAAWPQPADDEDLHLSLYLCYELHYQGLPGVADAWEWEPSLLALRRELEQRFEAELLAAVPRGDEAVDPTEADLALRAVDEADDAPSLSLFLKREGTLEQFREFAAHRSAYQLKEADPHSWAMPRLRGRPKAALVEIQADEYGGGREDRIHAELFARSMAAMGLDERYGAYLELLPAVTLRTVNLMSLLGLHRRLRGAIVGHLALFEMTSSIPNGRYADGLRRLGLSGDATEFFDEHVEADAVHEAVAAVDLAGGLIAQDPAMAGDVLWGARCLTWVEAAWTRHLLEAWEAGVTSLRAPLQLAAPA